MLRSAQEAVLSVNDEPKKAVVIQPAEKLQNIPFLDQKDLFTILSRHASLKDMGRLRRTCRAAYHRFDDQATAEPMRMLELVGQLDITALDKFTKNNAALIESWRENASHNHAAFVVYSLLGDARKLDMQNYFYAVEWLKEQKISMVIVDSVRLMFDVRETYGDHVHFSKTLDLLATHYEADPRLGEIRSMLLYFLFQATRLLEKSGGRSIDECYEKAKSVLVIAQNHKLFAMHRGHNILFRHFLGGLTTSQHKIEHEIHQVETRYAAIPKYNKPNYDN